MKNIELNKIDKDKMLFPSCSEVCWRLDLMPAMKIQERIVYTLENKPIDDDDYNQYGQEDDKINVFNDMVETLEQFKKEKLDYKKICKLEKRRNIF